VKFGYAIVLALVALVAVTGFASADRLPQQVPENQIFTIDTLIDVTGAVTEDSQLQWTIISGDVQVTGMIFDQNNGDPDRRVVIPAANKPQLDRAVADWVARYGGSASDYIRATPLNDGTGRWLLSYFYVPDMELDSVSNFMWNSDDHSGRTWREFVTWFTGQFPLYAVDTDTIFAAIHDDALNVGEEIAILTWQDSIRTNGGKLSLNKNIDFNSKNMGKGLDNLQAEKVLTYASTEGAHLVGAESWMLDVAGNWERAGDSIRCVFASARPNFFPAFCNVVKAKSELININSAQISTKGGARAVAATGDVPASLAYQIAVTPDSNSGSGFADGTVKTMFGGSIMEARGDNNVPAATNEWKDSASVTGGIKNFQKVFTYESGFTI